MTEYTTCTDTTRQFICLSDVNTWGGIVKMIEMKGGILCNTQYNMMSVDKTHKLFEE